MAGFLAALGPVLKGVGALAGAFGKRKSTTQSETVAGIMGQAQGARDAAEKYGFNPLTLLQASSPIAGAGTAPPLASLSVLGDIVEENFGQDAKDRREHNRLQNELLTLEVDRARSLNKVAAPSALAGAALTPRGSAVQVSGPRAASPTAFGPPAPVRVRNGMTGAWLNLDPGVAARLRLSPFETIIAEDFEALLGDVASEAVNLGGFGLAAVTGAGPVLLDPPKPKRKYTAVPLKTVKRVEKKPAQKMTTTPRY
jgi:hypothetical protein